MSRLTTTPRPATTAEPPDSPDHPRGDFALVCGALSIALAVTAVSAAPAFFGVAALALGSISHGLPGSKACGVVGALIAIPCMLLGMHLAGMSR
jgi:hypothetical protein